MKTVPSIWKPTLKSGLMVDVSEPGLARLLRDASHLASRLVGMEHVAREAVNGDAHAVRAILTMPAGASQELRALEARLAAAARFMTDMETDCSDIAPEPEDAPLFASKV